MKLFTTNSPTQIHVKVAKTGWIKRSYHFLSGDDTVAELNYSRSYSHHATARIHETEFEIRRCGFWKQYLQISSTSNEQYNMKVDLSWMGTMKVMDTDRNELIFRQTNMWKRKWGWFHNRSERLLVEMRSKNFSRKNRGIIEIKDPGMKNLLFWIIVSWFVVMSSETDGTSAAVI